MPTNFTPGALPLWRKAHSLAKQSIGSDTFTVYQSGVRCFQDFLIEISPNLVTPLDDAAWAMFYTFCLERVSPPTAANYITHVAFMFETIYHIPRPIWKSLPLYSRAKKGANRTHIKPRKRKHPITWELACLIIDIFDMNPLTVARLSGVLIFIVILITGLCGWMRLGELIPKKTDVHPEKLLRRGQVTFFHQAGQTPYMRLWLFRSKGDRFFEGVPIFVPAYTPNPRYCPVTWMRALFRVTRTPTTSSTDPLFRFPNGRLVLRQRFVRWLKIQLKIIGIDPSQYSGHSLRIGAAVSAARRGMDETLIQRLGRWKSDAYLGYIKYMPTDMMKLRELIGQMGTIH